MSVPVTVSVSAPKHDHTVPLRISTVFDFENDTVGVRLRTDTVQSGAVTVRYGHKINIYSNPRLLTFDSSLHEIAVNGLVKQVRVVEERLGRYASDVQAGTTESVVLLDASSLV